MALFAADSSMSWIGALALMIGVGVLLVGAGWIVIEVARRGADGRLQRNGWAGVRTSATRSSDDAWLAAHAASHDLTVRGGRIAAATGVLSVPAALAIGRGLPSAPSAPGVSRP